MPASEEVDAYRALLSQLDGTRFVAVHMPARVGIDLRSDAGFDALVTEQGDLTGFMLESFPNGTFSHTLSVWEAMRAGNYMFAKIATAGNPPASAYSVPSDPVSYQQVRDEVRGDSGKDVLAANGQSAIVLLFLNAPNDAAARSVSAAVARELAQWDTMTVVDRATGTPQASGLAYVSHLTDERTAADLRVWATVAAIVTGLTLLVVVRRIGDIISASASLVLASLAAFGILGWLRVEVNFLTVFLAPIVSGIGMDYALHILHRNRQNRESGQPRKAALAQALRHMGPAVSVSALCTAAGLAVLLFVDAPLFAQVGLLGALGVALGLLASLAVAPALRAILPERPVRVHRDHLGAAMARTASALGRPGVAIPILVLLVVAGVAGALNVRTSSGTSQNEFPQDDPAIVLQHRIEDEYGAFQRAYIVVEGDITQPAVLRALANATAAAPARVPGLRQASSITDLLLADAATDQGALDIAASQLPPLPIGLPVPDAAPEPGGPSLPATQAEARAGLDRLFSDPLWRGLAPFTISRDYRLAVVALQVQPWNSTEDLAALAKSVRELAAEVTHDAGPAMRVTAAGAPLNRDAVAKAIPGDVLLSTLGVAAVVGTGLAISWRRRGAAGAGAALAGIGLALMSALLLLATVAGLDTAYARTPGGTSEAPLSQMFLLALAVTVAVGVDGHVQIVHEAWALRDDGLTRSAAVRQAYANVGRAVLGTALTTIAAFAPLSGLYFLQSRNLAILTAAGAAFALFLTFLVTPLVAGRLGRAVCDHDRNPIGVDASALEFRGPVNRVSPNAKLAATAARSIGLTVPGAIEAAASP
ncbi:MAG: MMPL family transporter [Thermoplasmatota archaeon]